LKLEILVDGRPVNLESVDLQSVDVREVEPAVFSILYEGRSFEARVIPAGPNVSVEVGPRNLSVEIQDPRNASTKSKSALSGHQEVKAAMPGKVVRILVSEGQVIEPGQGLIVVEAMKMQNEMKAARAGTISRIQAREGATVSAGEVLLSID
jgi:biotin carboxyl carrier protein